MKKIQWLVFTVLLGAMPIFCKFFIILFMKNKEWDLLLNEVDIATYGLVLSITSFHELQNQIFQDDGVWRMKRIGASIALIFVFGIIFATSTIADITDTSGTFDNLFDRRTLKFSAVFLVICSLIFTFSIYQRLSKANPNG